VEEKKETNKETKEKLKKKEKQITFGHNKKG